MLHADRHAHSSGLLQVVQNALWLTGNGTLSRGQLVDANGNPISAAIAPQIYRADWQGNQLLYPTARTAQPHTQDSSGWGTVNATASTVSVGGPDGGSYVAFTEDTTTNFRQIYSVSQICGANLTTTAILDIKLLVAADGVRNLLKGYFSTNTNHNFQINLATQDITTFGPCTCVFAGVLPNGFQRYLVSITIDANDPSTSAPLLVGPDNLGSYLGTGEIIWAVRADLRPPGQPLGSYIDNATSSPLTLTDYTLSGTTVNLAQAPVSGALCTWSGLYIP